MKSQKGYDSASVLSEQAKQICCPVTETRVSPAIHSTQALRPAPSLINLPTWVGNIKSRDLKMSNSIEGESLCNTGSTQFKVRQLGTDCKALGSRSCLIRLGG